MTKIPVRSVELPIPLFLRRGPEKGKYLFKIIELNRCLVVEVGAREGRRHRRLLAKFFREGGLDGFDRAGRYELGVLEHVWHCIRELSGGEADDLQTDRREDQEQSVQLQDQRTEQVEAVFVE